MKYKFLSKSPNYMIKECSYYKSTMISCNCGEVTLESSLYKTKMKCPYMIFRCIQNGEKIETIELPKCPKIKLKYKTKFKSNLEKKNEC